MPPERWAGFALVWLALSLLTWDALRTARRTARVLREQLNRTGPGVPPVKEGAAERESGDSVARSAT